MAVARLVECSDSSAWNNYVLSSSGATVFHRFEWAQILSQIYSYPIYSIILESDGEIGGILPLVRVKSKFFGDRLVSMPFSDYGGIVADSEENADIIWKEAEALTRKLGVDYIEVRMPCRSLEECHQTYISGHSYLVDLGDTEEEIWGRLEKRTRNGIRSAQRRGMKAIAVTNESELREYYALHQITMRRHGSPCHPYRFFEELWSVFSSLGVIRILLGRMEGKTIAGAIFLSNNGRIHYWSSVSLDEAHRMNAGNLILWEAMIEGKRSGCHSIDMGRTRPGTGVDLFKRGWGGKSIELNHLYYSPDHSNIHPPDPSRFRYRVMSLVWKKVPVLFTQIVGPRVMADIAL